MEGNFVYMTTEQIEERKAKIAAIEGLDEIRAAIKKRHAYFQAKMQFERGEIDYADVPAYNPNERSDLRKKYPRAAVFLEAEQWINDENPVKVRLGSRAMEKILNGWDPYLVLDEMNTCLDAFNMAQGG